eukprot:Partr_v1_DN25030_c0_g1_i2_m50863 putative PRP18 pre-mRNA processing factor 18 homolog
MDLLATIQQEISRKRKALDSASGSHPLKVVKKSSLEAASIATKMVDDDDSVSVQDLSTLPNEADNEEPAIEDSSYTDEELRSLFREMKEPFKLFGETREDQLARLRKLESGNVMSLEAYSVQNLPSKKITGDQLLLETADNVDSHAPAATSKAEKVRRAIADNRASFYLISFGYMRSDRDHCYSLIYMYLKDLLFSWQDSLDTTGDRLTEEYRRDSMVLKRAVEDIRPLFKMIKQKSLADDVEEKLTEICHWIYRREYVKANDCYMRLAIGNACWPIGVAAVGIHERKARDRIGQGQAGVAHVLNDEKQRKWVQSVKRIMTFAQKRFPPDDITKAIG